jgi:hypothetical protein
MGERKSSRARRDRLLLSRVARVTRGERIEWGTTVWVLMGLRFPDWSRRDDEFDSYGGSIHGNREQAADEEPW